MKRKIIKTIALMSLIGTTALSSVNFNAYASETSANTVSSSQHERRTPPTEEQRAAHLEKMKAELAEKLASGKISQETYDKILASIESGDFKNGNHVRPDGEKTEKKELTEEEKAAHLEKMKAELSEKLASGKITQETYDRILASITSGDFKNGNHMRPNGGNHMRPNGEKQAKKERTEEPTA